MGEKGPSIVVMVDGNWLVLWDISLVMNLVNVLWVIDLGPVS